MKKTILISIFLLEILVCFCQSIVTSNKLWYNIIWYNTHPYPEIGTEIIKFTNDTVIDSLTYKKVERSLDEGQMTWSAYGYIREKPGKQIFYKYNPLDTERLLYDLNVQLHDTILAYSVNTDMGSYQGMVPMTLYVNLIDSVLIGDIYQKRINLGGYPNDSLTIWSQWTDSTGSMEGMLHNRYDYLTIDAYDLACFFKNGILQYHDSSYASCFNPTIIQEKDCLQPVVTIYPNPLINVSMLSIYGIKKVNSISIRFYNLLGEEILNKYCEKEIEINKNDISSSGIYFYRVIINHKMLRTGKLIIN